ncbi:MAG: winged helix-turn-helix transcriptional regulator, partial [Phascolarctobacterium sp.]|nr:winged helix-turn-helix transcriptional regulator [Phascolarctobacterium sp.]
YGEQLQKVLPAGAVRFVMDGLLTRKVYAEVPPRVEYTLTELGESLRPILFAMQQWGLEYQKLHKPNV